MCLSFILFTGGRGSASVHAGIPPPPWADTTTPPQTRQTPPDQADTPLDQADTPPRPGRYPPDQADTQPPTPPNQADTPHGKQTSAYGLRAAGTHPTGMHSCFVCVLTHCFVYQMNEMCRTRSPTLLFSLSVCKGLLRFIFEWHTCRPFGN